MLIKRGYMKRDNKFQAKCFDFVLVNYRKIPYDKFKKAEFALSNSACHLNAVAAFNGGRADKVWLIWGGKKNGCIHFINSTKGVFFDETWHDYEKQDYYIIREVNKHEFEDIYDLLCATKRMLFNINGSFLDKLRSKKDIHGWI